MDNLYCIGPDGELYHHGIKGMKWYQRRFQNKDGSLTPAGKKRYKSTQEELKAREKVIKNKERVRAMEAKQAAKKAELDAREAALNDGPKKKTLKEVIQERKEAKAAKNSKPLDTGSAKSIKDMTDDELREYTNRMYLESQYLNAQRNLASLTPKKVNKGKEFAEKMLKENIAPALSKAGKEYLEKMLKDAMGLNEKEVNTLKKLEDEWKELDYRQRIDKIKNPDKYLSEEDKSKRQKREDDAEDRAARMEGYVDAADKARKQAAEKRQADEAARTANEERSRRQFEGQYTSKGGEKTDVNTDKAREGDVVGVGTSTGKKDSGSSYTPPKLIFDMEDTPVTSLTTTHNSYSSAKSYVSDYYDTPVIDLPSPNISGYLPAPKDDD